MRILLALLFVVSACSKKKEEAPAPSPGSAAASPKPTDPGPDEKPTPTEAAKPAPTKEAGIARLKEVLAALEAKDTTKAASYFMLPANVPAEKIADELGNLIEKHEISGPGIEVLATKGKWGKLAEVFEPERAARWAEKSGVPVDQCWGFAVDGVTANASVGFHWDGKDLKLIRLNNVGKL